MTSLTLIAVAIFLLGLLTPLKLPRALALGASTATGAALILNDRVVVSLFSAIAVAVILAAAIFGLIRPETYSLNAKPAPPGSLSLVLFGLWSIIVTAAGPLLFGGIAVLNTQGSTTPLGSTGVFTVSNIAQLAYIWIGILVAFIVARDRTSGPAVIEVALTAATLLNVWALVHQQFGFPFPEHFFDNSPNFEYISTAPDGSARFRGITSEPSALASVANPMIVFAVASFPSASGRRRVWLTALIGLSLWLGTLSTSTSFLVSNIALVLLAVFVLLARLVVQRIRLRRSAWIAVLAVSTATALSLANILNLVAASLTSKLDSDSYTVRSGADQFSYDLLFQTFGVGVGVGANRASSFIASLLSQTGVVGFVLFASAVVLILRSALPDLSARPVLWVALSFFIGRAFNGPDLGDSTGLTWLLLGVLSHAAVAREPAGLQSHLTPRLHPAVLY